MRDFNRLSLTGWFPGHMLKAGREIRERLGLIDVVVELLDARIPQTSRNPRLEETLGVKPCLFVFSKADLADPEATRQWLELLQKQGLTGVFVDAQRGHGVDAVLPAVRALWDKERVRRGTTRPLLRPLRILIAGLPNVGKSTLTNRLADRRKAIVGPKPGVTRQQQWVRLRDNVELMDTPGVLWPHIETKETELLLGICGMIKDDLIGEELLVEYLCFRLRRAGPRTSPRAYGLNAWPEEGEELLDVVAKRRGLLRAGGAPDRQQAAVALLNDFRSGRLGQVTFEMPRDG